MVLMNLFAGEQWRHRRREQTCECGRGGGRREWGEWREQHENTCTTIRKPESQWESAVGFREPKPGLCAILAGWVGGRREGGLTYACG